MQTVETKGLLKGKEATAQPGFKNKLTDQKTEAWTAERTRVAQAAVSLLQAQAWMQPHPEHPAALAYHPVLSRHASLTKAC